MKLFLFQALGRSEVVIYSSRFEGWYFKHQLGSDMIALIPGKSESGAFVQMLSPDGARYYPIPSLFVKNGGIHAGNCIFSLHGCQIDLPGVYGEIAYGETLPLKSDIMGPFQFLPMECRHGILSMGHSLTGSLTVDGTVHNFTGGMGYIEKDSGVSFPVSYQWLQCNDFSEPCSIMVSIARIPLGAVHFTGCICAIVLNGREFRLATYNGVHILSADKTHISLSQRSLQLVVDLVPSDAGHLLKSPVTGRMTGSIRESTNAKIHVRLWEHHQLILNLQSLHAAYEYVAPPKAALER